jgi:hypothetical protein
MMKRAWLIAFAVLFFVSLSAGAAAAGDIAVLGVTFPGEKVVAGKTLLLNGASYKKALGFIKVYAGGFYLERATKDPAQVIESEQVKHFHLEYLTSKATAEKLREGFIKAMEKGNPAELVEKHRATIEKHAGWFDKDMAPGKTSVTTYVPGKGLTVEYQGEVKGTIADREYARMYYRYIFGPTADERMKKAYLGLK